MALTRDLKGAAEVGSPGDFDCGAEKEGMPRPNRASAFAPPPKRESPPKPGGHEFTIEKPTISPILRMGSVCGEG